MSKVAASSIIEALKEQLTLGKPEESGYLKLIQGIKPQGSRVIKGQKYFKAFDLEEKNLPDELTQEVIPILQEKGWIVVEETLYLPFAELP